MTWRHDNAIFSVVHPEVTATYANVKYSLLLVSHDF